MALHAVQMTGAEIVATMGVTILLGAYYLVVTDRMASDDWRYHLANVVGAGLSCIASYLLRFFPFVVLEAVWCAVALWSLLRGRRTADP